MIRDGFWYFLDVFNYVDILSFTLNQLLLLTESETDEDLEQERIAWIRPVASVAVLLMWFKAFYWLRLFG